MRSASSPAVVRPTSARSRFRISSGGSSSSIPARSPTIVAAGANVAVSVTDLGRPSRTTVWSGTLAMSSSPSRDLPIPGSPRTVASTGSPVFVDRTRLSRRIVSSLARPTNGIVRRADRVERPSTGDRAERTVEALRLEVPPGAVGDGVLRQREGRLAGEHLTRQRAGLQASGPVHDRTGHEELADRADAHRRLARLDPDPDLELLGQAERLAEPPEPPADGQARSHRAERVVLAARSGARRPPSRRRR